MGDPWAMRLNPANEYRHHATWASKLRGETTKCDEELSSAVRQLGRLRQLLADQQKECADARRRADKVKNKIQLAVLEARNVDRRAHETAAAAAASYHAKRMHIATSRHAREMQSVRDRHEKKINAYLAAAAAQHVRSVSPAPAPALSRAPPPPPPPPPPPRMKAPQSAEQRQQQNQQQKRARAQANLMKELAAKLASRRIN